MCIGSRVVAMYSRHRRASIPPDRQVAKVDLPLTYFSKVGGASYIVLCNIFVALNQKATRYRHTAVKFTPKRLLYYAFLLLSFVTCDLSLLAVLVLYRVWIIAVIHHLNYFCLHMHAIWHVTV